MKQKEVCVLDLLALSPDGLLGMDMVRNSGGQLKRGTTVYLVLYDMEEKGLISSAEHNVVTDGVGVSITMSISRRVYQITEKGMEIYRKLKPIPQKEV